MSDFLTTDTFDQLKPTFDSIIDAYFKAADINDDEGTIDRTNFYRALYNYVVNSEEVPNIVLSATAELFGLNELREQYIIDQSIDDAAVESIKQTADIINANAEASANRTSSILDKILSGIVDIIATPIAAVLKDVWPSVINLFIKIGLLDEDQAKEFKDFTKEEPVVFILLALSTLGGFLSSWISIIGSTATGDYVKKLAGKFTPNAPSIDVLTRLYYIGGVTLDYVKKGFGQNGLSEEDWTATVKASQNRIDIATARELFYRGIIDDSKVNEIFFRMVILTMIATGSRGRFL